MRQKVYLVKKYQLHVRLSWIADPYAKIEIRNKKNKKEIGISNWMDKRKEPFLHKKCSKKDNRLTTNDFFPLNEFRIKFQLCLRKFAYDLWNDILWLFDRYKRKYSSFLVSRSQKQAIKEIVFICQQNRYKSAMIKD